MCWCGADCSQFADRSFVFHSTSIDWDGAKIPLRIPICAGDDDVSTSPFAPTLRPLLQQFRERLALLYNALLLGKRVLFLGYNVASNDVCAAVLAACLLISPPVEGLLLSRVFPYANLTDLDFLEVPGFIAGTTNPMFRQHTEWWDVLYDLHTNEVVASPQLEAADPRWAHMLSAAAAADRELFDAVLKGIDEEGAEEAWVRRQFEVRSVHPWCVVGL